ncbi:MAG: TIGR01212 family radical SAM protein, partial [Prevotellaceae bacterium]|nr:TIGR01212 family radical SAM protein [Prevotellaceae bacterium]
MCSHPLYYDFAPFMRRFFPFRVQKVSLDAGFTCPNRDGTQG